MDILDTEPNLIEPADTPKTSQNVVLEEITGRLPRTKWKNVGRIVQLKIIDDATVLTTGDGKLIWCIPTSLDGAVLQDAQAFVTTVSSSGLPTVQLRNITQSYDILTTKITVDASEFTSYTAATPRVIDPTKNVFKKGDLIAIDVDVAGTDTKGLGIILELQ